MVQSYYTFVEQMNTVHTLNWIWISVDLVRCLYF